MLGRTKNKNCTDTASWWRETECVVFLRDVRVLALCVCVCGLREGVVTVKLSHNIRFCPIKLNNSKT